MLCTIGAWLILISIAFDFASIAWITCLSASILDLFTLSGQFYHLEELLFTGFRLVKTLSQRSFRQNALKHRNESVQSNEHVLIVSTAPTEFLKEKHDTYDDSSRRSTSSVVSFCELDCPGDSSGCCMKFRSAILTICQAISGHLGLGFVSGRKER